MPDNRGVILLFFDLPSLTKEQKREYAAFRKKIKREGFTAIQESVYVKLLRSTSLLKKETEKVKDFCPADGSVLVLPMSLDVFSRLTSLTGENFDMELFANDTIYV